jgi:putative nucleotidyltransferase with HDIG domain
MANKLFDIFSNLQIEGGTKEKMEFNSFKVRVLSMLRNIDEKVLMELHSHHPKSLTHSIMVAKDTGYIARKLGLGEDVVISLEVAALFHDVGKLDIHEVILDLSNEDIVKVWAYFHKGEKFPENGVSIWDVTLGQVIEFKAKNSYDYEEFSSNFNQWFKKRGLLKFMNLPLRKYFEYHQPATRKILMNLGIEKNIVDYAAAHHLSYFDEDEKKNLPRECRIIEIADKFNAIIQSEGVRKYFLRKSKAGALEIIISELRKEFGIKENNVNGFENRILAIIAQRYLPEEIKVLKDEMSEFLKFSKEKVDIFNVKNSLNLIKKAEWLLDEVIAYSVIHIDFKNYINIDISNLLTFYLEVLCKILHIHKKEVDEKIIHKLVA